MIAEFKGRLGKKTTALLLSYGPQGDPRGIAPLTCGYEVSETVAPAIWIPAIRQPVPKTMPHEGTRWVILTLATPFATSRREWIGPMWPEVLGWGWRSITQRVACSQETPATSHTEACAATVVIHARSFTWTPNRMGRHDTSDVRPGVLPLNDGITVGQRLGRFLLGNPGGELNPCIPGLC